jgi:hypothetical protein
MCLASEPDEIHTRWGALSGARGPADAVFRHSKWPCLGAIASGDPASAGAADNEAIAPNMAARILLVMMSSLI